MNTVAGVFTHTNPRNKHIPYSTLPGPQKQSTSCTPPLGQHHVAKQRPRAQLSLILHPPAHILHFCASGLVSCAARQKKMTTYESATSSIKHGRGDTYSTSTSTVPAPPLGKDAKFSGEAIFGACFCTRLPHCSSREQSEAGVLCTRLRNCRRQTYTSTRRKGLTDTHGTMSLRSRVPQRRGSRRKQHVQRSAPACFL